MIRYPMKGLHGFEVLSLPKTLISNRDYDICLDLGKGGIEILVKTNKWHNLVSYSLNIRGTFFLWFLEERSSSCGEYDIFLSCEDYIISAYIEIKRFVIIVENFRIFRNSKNLIVDFSICPSRTKMAVLDEKCIKIYSAIDYFYNPSLLPSREIYHYPLFLLHEPVKKISLWKNILSTSKNTLCVGREEEFFVRFFEKHFINILGRDMIGEIKKYLL